MRHVAVSSEGAGPRSSFLMVALAAVVWVFNLSAQADTPSVSVSSEKGNAVTLQSDRPTRLSLGIFDQNGNMLRELARGQSVEAGTHTYTWDGLTRFGKAAPSSGRYEWRAVAFDGFTARFIGNLGNTHPDQNWLEWVGNHGGIASVTADETGFYLGSASTEGQSMLAKVSLDGTKRHWHMDQYYEAHGNTRRLATTSTHLLHLQARANLKTERARINRVHKTGGRQDWREARFDGHVPLDIDAANDIVVMTYPEANQLRWFNADIRPLAQYTGIQGASHVTMLAKDRPGTVLVASSDGAIYQLNPDNPKPEAVIEGLRQVIAIDIDHTTGELFVAERYPAENAAGSNTVIHRYDKNFNRTETFGGQTQTQGKPHPERFGTITDIATTGQGTLLITENGLFRRVVRRDTRTGDVLDVWYGPFTFYHHVEAEGGTSRDLWTVDEYRLMRWRFNPEGGPPQPLGAWWYLDNQLGSLLKQSVLNHHETWVPRHHKGKDYLFATKYPAVLEFDQATNTIIPRSFCGVMDLPPDQYPEWWKQVAKRAGLTNPKAEQPPQPFSWADDNGNGKVEPREVHVFRGQAPSLGERGDITEDFRYVWAGTLGSSDIFTLPVHKMTGPDRDIPRYHFARLKKVGQLPEPLRQGIWVRGVTVDETGAVYTSVPYGMMFHDVLHHSHWAGKGMRGNALAKINPDGKPAFVAGGKMYHHHQINTGRSHYTTDVILGPNDTVMLNEMFQNVGPTFTRDGLFLGNINQHRADDGLPDQAYHFRGDDNQNSKIFQIDDGRVFFISPGYGNQRIFQITGYDQINRLKGPIRRPNLPRVAKAQGTGLTLKLYNNERKTKLLHAAAEPTPGRFTLDNPPAPNLGNEYLIELTGFIEAPISGRYELELHHGDTEYLDLYLHGKPAASTRDQQPDIVTLTAGVKTPIAIQLKVNGPKPRMELRWQQVSLDLERIPLTALYPAPK